MAKSSSIYICQQCGYQSPTFLGKCPECGEWNSLVEQLTTDKQKTEDRRRIGTAEVIDISKLEKRDYARISTGIDEFDRVLGGGIVLGSLVLVSGDPGIGKSTLLTQLALQTPEEGKAVKQLSSVAVASAQPLNHSTSSLYVAGEESAKQIKLRVDRIKPGASLAVLNEVDVDVISGVIEQLQPKLVIIDSIQTLETQDLSAVAGSISQVRECAHRLHALAKKLHIPIFLVGHVTKEGTVAGPKTLEHLVDVVLSLEGDPQTNFRILRGNKNRFGPTDEVGIFEMEEAGMVEVKNPSKLFLEQKVDAPGSAVVSALNGLRPILVEIQALVTKSFLPMPRRVGTGVDNNRLQLLVAVLQKRLNLPLFDQDIFINVTGGIKVSEPAADLGIAMAIISSLKDKPLPIKTVFIGEVGLLGELRMVRGLDKRTNEAKKLGYIKVISPEKYKNLPQVLKEVIG